MRLVRALRLSLALAEDIARCCAHTSSGEDDLGSSSDRLSGLVGEAGRALPSFRAERVVLIFDMATAASRCRPRAYTSEQTAKASDKRWAS